MQMTRTIITLTLFWICNTIYGQPYEARIVSNFGNFLTEWCNTGDIDNRESAQKLCASGCRVNDQLMIDFARKDGLSIKNYVIPKYLNGFQDAIDKGNVNVRFTYIRPVSKEEFLYTQSENKNKKMESECQLVVYKINATGALNYDVSDLFYIHKGKIVKIDSYNEEVDTRTGKRRVKVDFSDIEDTEMLGFTINHDQHFPIGASIVGQFSWFMCSLDVGINMDSKTYISDKAIMTDILNYERTKSQYDPKFFMTLTPAVFFKYVSVGCGLGIVYLGGTEEHSELSTKVPSASNNLNVTGSTNTSETSTLKLMVRPQLKGYIPLSSSCNMSLGVGYDIVPKMKELNGYSFSIGFHFDFDGWESLIPFF